MPDPSFTPEGYAALLLLARDAGYRLVPLAEGVAARGASPVMMLRHDVDLSLDHALAMAELEHGLGVRSTYFILPYNDFYNPLAPAGRDKVARIRALGHEIGLHWDSSLYHPDPAILKAQFRRDVEILSDVAGAPVVSASQHIPIDTPGLDVSSLIEFEAYSGPVRELFTYVSDSAMAWRGTTPADLVARRVDIQFLAHPVWWMAPGPDRSAKLAALGEEQARAARERMKAFDEYVAACLAERAALDRRYNERRAGQ